MARIARRQRVVKHHINLTAQQYGALRDIAFRQVRSVSSLVREIIGEWLARQGKGVRRKS